MACNTKNVMVFILLKKVIFSLKKNLNTWKQVSCQLYLVLDLSMLSIACWLNFDWLIPEGPKISTFLLFGFLDSTQAHCCGIICIIAPLHQNRKLKSQQNNFHTRQLAPRDIWADVYVHSTGRKAEQLLPHQTFMNFFFSPNCKRLKCSVTCNHILHSDIKNICKLHT